MPVTLNLLLAEVGCTSVFTEGRGLVPRPFVCSQVSMRYDRDAAAEAKPNVKQLTRDQTSRTHSTATAEAKEPPPISSYGTFSTINLL